MVEVSACLGMMLGPIIGGVLKRLVGYTCMNLSFSKWFKTLDFAHTNFDRSSLYPFDISCLLFSEAQAHLILSLHLDVHSLLDSYFS